MATMDRWIILPPNDLPSEVELDNLLGAIVSDCQNPLANYFPTDVKSELRKDMLAEPTPDANFAITLSQMHNGEAKARLGSIFTGDFKHDRTDAQQFKSVTVTTHKIKQHNDLFRSLKSKYQQTILNMMLENHEKSGTYGLYFIVGIKLSQDAVISSDKSSTSDTSITMKAPVKEAMGPHGVALPDIDPELTVSRTDQEKAQKDMTAKGSRIFAIQACMVGRSKTHNPLAHLHAPKDFDLGGYAGSVSTFRSTGLRRPADPTDGSDNVMDRQGNIVFEDYLGSGDIVMTNL